MRPDKSGSAVKPGQHLSKLTWDKLNGLTEEYQDIEYLRKTGVEELKDVSDVDANLLAATDCEIVLTAIAAELKRRETLELVEDKRSLATAVKEVNGRKNRLVTIRGYLASQRSKLQDRRRTVVATDNLGPRDNLGSRDGEESSTGKRGPASSSGRDKQNGGVDDFSSSHTPGPASTSVLETGANEVIFCMFFSFHITTMDPSCFYTGERR